MKRLHELLALRGVLHVYDGKVTIDLHLSGRIKPTLILCNLIPDVGRAYILGNGNSFSDISQVALGDNGTAKTRADTQLNNERFRAGPTDWRVVGLQRFTEFFVGINDANFTHREFGLFAGTNIGGANEGTPLSLLVITPEWEKTEALTRTYIHVFDFS